MTRRLLPALPWLALVGVLAGLYFVSFISELRFNADAERDLLEVYAFAHHGRPIARGVLNTPLGLDLGPLYFLLLAPANALWPSPLSVHAVNVLLLLGGLVTFGLGVARQTRVGIGVLTALLLGLSEGTAALLMTPYHVGASAGLAAAVVGAALAFESTSRQGWLLFAVAALAALLQVHPFGAVFVPPLAWLLWSRRRDVPIAARRRAALLFSLLVLPMPFYAVPSLIQGDLGGARHGGGAGFEPWMALVGAVEGVRPHWLLAASPTAWLVIVAAIVALVRPGAPAGPRRYLGLQLGLGLLTVAIALGFETSARYWMPVVPAVVALVGLGLHRLLPSRLAPPAVTAALAGLALVFPPMGRLTCTPPEGSALTLVEQQAVVGLLVGERGLTWTDLSGRVHGSLLGAFTGPRYLERLAREQRAVQVPASGAWLVAPEGVPVPTLTGRVLESLAIAPAGRRVVLTRFRPGVALESTAAGGEPCGRVLPYVWSQQTTELLHHLGFAGGHGADVHPCLRRGPLSLALEPGAFELAIDVTDDGLFRGAPTDVAVSLDGIRLDTRVVRLADRQRVLVSLPEGPAGRRLEVDIAAGRVSFMDVF